MSTYTLLIRAGMILVAATAAAACSTSKPSSTADIPTAPSTGAASPSDSVGTTHSPGNVPTGAKLKTLMPTAADLPAGWKLGDASTAFDTGTDVKTPSAPLLPDDDCAQAMTNGGAKTLTSDYQAAYATQGLTSPNDTDSAVVFNSYQPGDAVKQMDEVSALAKRCASFKTQDTGGKTVQMATTATAVPGLGDAALDVKVTPTGPYVADEIILVRSGDVIMAVDADSQSGPMPDVLSLARQLAKPLPLKP